MAVFRVEKTKNYTVMSNYHLKDKSISLKAKGLLSQMLSLPDNWNYTLEGLAQLNKEKIDAIRAAVKELEGAGYIQRSRERDKKGRLGDTVYVIFEQPNHPTLENPTLENPTLENPTLGNPTLGNPTLGNPTLEEPTLEEPMLGNPMQLNTNTSSTKRLNTKSINPSFKVVHETKRKETMSLEEINSYREFIQDNIDYDVLVSQTGTPEILDEIVELIVETVCGARNSIWISGADYPHEIVRSKFLKLNKDHIEYVMDGLKNNTTHIRNIKAYLLASLFNAPTTINNAYNAQVNHDESI